MGVKGAPSLHRPGLSTTCAGPARHRGRRNRRSGCVRIQAGLANEEHFHKMRFGVAVIWVGPAKRQRPPAPAVTPQYLRASRSFSWADRPSSAVQSASRRGASAQQAACGDISYVAGSRRSAMWLFAVCRGRSWSDPHLRLTGVPHSNPYRPTNIEAGGAKNPEDTGVAAGIIGRTRRSRARDSASKAQRRGRDLLARSPIRVGGTGSGSSCHPGWGRGPPERSATQAERRRSRHSML